MILDDPDEDADGFDDESELEPAVADATPKRRDVVEASTLLPDWPSPPGREVAITIDPATLTWFRSTYVDWQHQVSSVLRAWVAAQQAGKLPAVQKSLT